jgi:ABC-2 type transport system permease protein
VELHDWRRFARMTVVQVRVEFLKLWRIPSFSIMTIAFPLMLFAFFGLPNAGGHTGGVRTGAYLLGSFGVYAMTTVMLFSFGVGVAVERGQNIDLLMRVTPLRPLAALLGRSITAVAFGLITLAALFTFAGLTAGIHMPVATWLRITALLIGGALPFLVIGYAIGYAAGPSTAPVVLNIVYLPLSFASGILLPLPYLPHPIQLAAPYLPTYRYAQLVWGTLGVRTDGLLANGLWLAAYLVVFFVVALLAYRREEMRRFA